MTLKPCSTTSHLLVKWWIFLWTKTQQKFAVGWFHQVILISIFHIISHYPMSYYYHPITMQKILWQFHDKIPSNPSRETNFESCFHIFPIYPLIFSHIPLLYHWNFHNISFFLMLQPPYFFPLKSHEIPGKISSSNLAVAYHRGIF